MNAVIKTVVILIFVGLPLYATYKEYCAGSGRYTILAIAATFLGVGISYMLLH